MPSVTVEAIRAISQRLKPRLAPSNWRRKSPHFVRAQNEVIHGIHFQASQFGTADAGTFTINLIVTEPRVYQAWCGLPLPSNPATSLFPVNLRIGRLESEQRDLWWEVADGTNISSLESEIFELLQNAEETFFSQFASLDVMLNGLRTTGQLPGLHGGQNGVVHGLIAAILGHTSEAESVLRDLAADSTFPAFTENVRNAAQNVGITI